MGTSDPNQCNNREWSMRCWFLLASFINTILLVKIHLQYFHAKRSWRGSCFNIKLSTDALLYRIPLSNLIIIVPMCTKYSTHSTIHIIKYMQHLHVWRVIILPHYHVHTDPKNFAEFFLRTLILYVSFIIQKNPFLPVFSKQYK